MNQNPPLKLLSSLTNMVNSNTSKENILSIQKTLPGAASIVTDQPQNVCPVVFQIPGGSGNIVSTHMLNTSRLTPAQLVELQKSLVAHQQKQMNVIQQNYMSQPQSNIQSIVTTTSADTSNVIVGLQPKNAPVQNFVMVTNSGQTKTVNTLQNASTSLQSSPLLQQKSQTQTPSTSTMTKDNVIINKALQDQLRHLTLAQREQLLKHYMSAGKTSVGNVTAPMLLASILKNKQGSFPMQTVVQQTRAAASTPTLQALKKTKV